MLQSVWACRTIKLKKVLFSISGKECKSTSILSTITGQTITNDNGHSAVICCQCSARLLSFYQHQQHAKEIREKVLNDFLGCVARTNVELANDTDSVTKLSQMAATAVVLLQKEPARRLVSLNNGIMVQGCARTNT